MLREFREFILRGNVLDMAVGIIIGAAFGGVVNSLVADVLDFDGALEARADRVDPARAEDGGQDGRAGHESDRKRTGNPGSCPDEDLPSARHPFPVRPLPAGGAPAYNGRP